MRMDPRMYQMMMQNGFMPQGGMAMMPQYQQPMPGYPNGGLVVQQQPGHSVVIQQGQNGQPQVTQVPGFVQQGHSVIG
jgi:hypothetical protein